MRLTVVAVLLSWCIAGCAALAQRAPPLQPDAQSRLAWAEVLRLRSARDYFTLRDRLEEAEPEATSPARYARAVVEQAFNEAGASNATIAALLAESTLPDSLAAELRQIQLSNHLRLFE